MSGYDRYLVLLRRVLRCSWRCALIALSATNVRQIGIAIHAIGVSKRSSMPELVGAAPNAATRKSSELKSVVMKKCPFCTPTGRSE